MIKILKHNVSFLYSAKFFSYIIYSSKTNWHDSDIAIYSYPCLAVTNEGVVCYGGKFNERKQTVICLWVQKSYDNIVTLLDLSLKRVGVT